MEEKPLKLSFTAKQDFQTWNEIAFALNAFIPRLEFNEGEIWWCYLGMNIGDEQRGKGENFLRPVVILQKYNERLCLIVPLTSNLRKNAYSFIFQFEPTRKSAAILSQAHSIDSQRLHTIMGVVDKKDMGTLKEKLKALLP